ncbi:AMP-binding protein [Nocardia brasiliensis]|uniref:AMP-binding protein n=1 Tax=Nocardia brasiliensis TaxID=37326 RepID=UPI0018955457|nr:AMP-binding protein [Nocardia brasiliensis]MBF6543063.1 AMP-binding protein [Nocardia brasiliensis]
MTLLRSGPAAAAAFVRARVVWPVGPAAAARMGVAVLRNGSNPAVLLSVSAARWPDRTAVVDERGTLTYAELSALADAIAGGLRTDYGIGPGAAVAVLCRNSRYYAAGLFGVLATGADVVLLNTGFAAETLARSLTGQSVAAVLCDAEFVPVVRAAGYEGPVVICYAELEAAGDSVAAMVRRGLRAPVRVQAGRLVILTSGTTGTPKGVPRDPAASAVVGTATSLLRRTGLRTGAAVAVEIPLFHGFGLGVLLLGIALGGKLILRRHFDAAATLAAVSEHRVRMLAMVPVMLQRILAVPVADRARFDRSSLSVVLCGAAPLRPALATEFIEAFGEVLYNGYGSSEVGIGSLATPADLRGAPGTVGRPVLGTEVRVLDDAGRRVPPGVVGHVFVGSALGFTGYTGGGDKGRVDGLINSGDLGSLDAHGRLFLAGREDDMIVSGGENVYPQEVEDVVAAHPELCDVAVIGVDDDEFGQRLAAFAVPEPGCAPSVDDIREYLRHNVSRFQQPRDIRLVAEIPRNPSGKIDRPALRSLLLQPPG